ncbi:MAG: hypothetical protein RLY20_1061 [Verrucomicrobiota bacterium]|jgi:hypothetical protein
MKTGNSQGAPLQIGAKFWAAAVFLILLLSVLFWKSFLPGVVHFSNDGPLGALMADQMNPKDGITGQWIDLNSTGYSAGNTPVGIWSFLWMAMGAVWYSKFITPICLLVLGIGAWFFFRRLGFAPAACLIGSTAATLNTCFLSDACWGVAPHSTAFGMAMLAMGLVVLAQSEAKMLRKWALIALAGMAVGVNVIEASDIGAMFSVIVAAFVIFHALTDREGSVAGRLIGGGVRVAVIAAMAGFISFQSVTGLIGSSIKNVSVVEDADKEQSKAANYQWATQWSLPPKETITLAVPGIFGYRLDSPEGANYWGMIGSDPVWDGYLADGRKGPPPQAMARFSGTLGYTGVLVLLVGAWAVTMAARRKDSIYSPQERKLIGFWLVVAIVALLMSWGRFSGLYKCIYNGYVPILSEMPYVGEAVKYGLAPISKFLSVSRNPTKFLYIVNFALVIIFAYGLNGLWKRHVVAPGVTPRGLFRWLGELGGPDRGWVMGSLLLFGAALFGAFIYTGSQPKLESFLAVVGFPGKIGKTIATFSIESTWVFVVLLAVAIGLLFLTMSGSFSGTRAKWFGLLLGGFTIFDLGRAGSHFIIHWDYIQKYDLAVKNPVIEFLSAHPYENRVAALPFPMPEQFDLLNQMYRIEWTQHHFLYRNIQSLDVIQMPRPPKDIAAFESAWRAHQNEGLLRRWELTNTRYLIGPAAIFEMLNQQIDPVQRRFAVKLPFDIAPKPGLRETSKLEHLTAVANPNGANAIGEFRGALPRASLYANWTVSTNESLILSNLFEASFDPHKSVIVMSDKLAPGTSTNISAGTVEIKGYKPKRVEIAANVTEPAILLLNDRYDENWKVTVDGQPAELLKANFFMRGVKLVPGQHTVVYTFRLPAGALNITLGGIAVTLLLIGYVVISRPKSDATQAKTT